ncbi:TRAP transporter small permease [Paenibacillus sp. 7124]|uniref:TRAP transporter small permease n=1 Tax=Paenibacillus apii TaxID=1850370 RepID=A0A6M1PKY5_9BACL|nr:TRAP transporter small permease [Paenibacillus apii]NJJ40552.1 TRAP transporter small permease [Paenibacillus apii]
MERVNELKAVRKESTRSDWKEGAASILNALEKISLRVNQFLAVIAGLAMLLIALLIVANVIIRVFYVPIPGVGEISGWLSAITAAFALGYTQIHRGHVDIDVILEKFPARIRGPVQGLMLLISMLFFGLISYRLAIYAYETMKSGGLSETLAVIYYPYIYLLAIGFFGLTLSLLTDSLKYLVRGDRR